MRGASRHSGLTCYSVTALPAGNQGTSSTAAGTYCRGIEGPLIAGASTHEAVSSPVLIWLFPISFRMAVRIQPVLLSRFMPCPRKCLWGIAVGFSLSLGPSIALGQTDDERAGARAAASSGIEAYNAGRYAEAYDLLNRAESLVHAPPHMLYMARAAAKLGRLVQAREIYIKIGQEQLVAAAPRAFIDAQQAAVQEQRALESRLAYLTVTVEAANASNVKVSIDGKTIPNVLMGVPIPVDPGAHNLLATASSGDHSDTVKMTLAEGQRDRVTLTIRPNTAGEAPLAVAPAPAPAQVSSRPAAAPPAASTAEASGKKTPVLAWVSLGVGAAGAGLGTVFLIQRSSKKSDADSAFNGCNASVCTQPERDHIKDLDKSAASAGTLALVSYGVGAAALTTGFYLLFSSGSTAEPKKDSARFVPYVGPRFVGATLSF